MLFFKLRIKISHFRRFSRQIPRFSGLFPLVLYAISKFLLPVGTVCIRNSSKIHRRCTPLMIFFKLRIKISHFHGFSRQIPRFSNLFPLILYAISKFLLPVGTVCIRNSPKTHRRVHQAAPRPGRRPTTKAAPTGAAFNCRITAKSLFCHLRNPFRDNVHQAVRARQRIYEFAVACYNKGRVFCWR